MRLQRLQVSAVLLLVLTRVLATGVPSRAAQLQIVLPLNRVAYQTNELIDVSVVRRDAQPLPAADLDLTVTGEDGSKLVFAFPVKAVAVAGNEARTTEHLHLNGWLLRPGKYLLEAAAYGAVAQANIEVYSHIRKSSFRIIDWGTSAKGPEQALLTEDGLGFNLVMASYGGFDQDENIRGGLDFIRNCTMGGAHQMDMRLECDWSDPYVLGGGRARVVREALKDRTCPNTIGVHFYDEPGLTWQKNPRTGEFTGHGIPAQEQSFKSAFGEDPPQYDKVKPEDPASVAAWDQWARWKLGFMDAAWKYAAFGVSYVRPDYLSATQSEYGWHAFGDGYYFNVVRSLPVISGHGGYDDYAGGYMNPSHYHEMGRMRDLNKPSWYLPTWYEMPSDNYRLEQYLSFINNLQGMCMPPTMAIQTPNKLQTADGVVETNKTMARLGTVFTTMPPTRCDVAVLYSMTQNVYAQSRNMMDFQDFPGQLERILVLNFASKMSHIPLFPLVEEDVVDGTLAANHKAIVLTGINALEPRVVAALEAFIASGHTVILSDDCTVQIKGATRLGVPITTDIYVKAQKTFAEAGPAGRTKGLMARSPGVYFAAATPVAAALAARCKAIGVQPIFACDSGEIVGSRQAQGDIEYLFAVNATWDANGGQMNSIKPARATISLPDDGRPIYDAVHGGPAAGFARKNGMISAAVRFGAGEMRAFARTARPISGVQVQKPVVSSDYTRAEAPTRVAFSAVLMDDQNHALAASVPLRIHVLDPLGVTRYDLYRATTDGIWKMELPLAANDPAGDWKVSVKELLNNTEGAATFAYAPGAQCGALAGATQRAVLFGNDRQNIYRFFRTHQQVTIVRGKSDYNAAAASRLADILKPWGIHCAVVDAADVAKPRALPAEAAPTWVGLNGRDAGFDVDGAVILIGTPEDNPLIKFLLDQSFLPYKPGPDFPGHGRGMLAWQLDGVGQAQESVTAIAYDGAGMSEAVGALYEVAAGLDPLTPLDLPSVAGVTPAGKAVDVYPEALTVWSVNLPDRSTWLKADAKGQVSACTWDGSLITLDAAGKILEQKDASKDDMAAGPKVSVDTGTVPKEKLAARRVVKTVVTGNGFTAIGYWGGTVQVFSAAGDLLAQQLLPNDIASMTWDGNLVIVGLADGELLGLKPRQAQPLAGAHTG